MNWTSLRERLLGENPADIRPPKLAIPPLPTVAIEFCRAADRQDVSLVELATILERDAGLVVDLLKLVNSSSFGMRNKVNSVRTALNLLGPRRAKMFVLTSGVQTVSAKTKSPIATPNRFSFASIQRAVFARRMVERLGLDAEFAFAGALLQDFTIPALTAEQPDRYQRWQNQLTDDVSSIAELEQARQGWDHAMAGARLLLSWQIPDDLICLVLMHHWLTPILNSPALSASELVVVALSSLLPDPLQGSPSRTARLEQLLTERFQIDVDPLREQVAEDLRATAVGSDPSLAWTSLPNAAPDRVPAGRAETACC